MYSPLRVVVVGCTPLAEKVVSTILTMDEVALVGVVNLHPLTGLHKSNYCQMAGFAEERPEDIYYTKDINDHASCEWIRQRDPHVIVQAGWSQIFKRHVLDLPHLYCIGIHPAPLPEGRGAAIINWRLIEGGGPWGNSLFVMEEKSDTGDILDFEPFTLEPRDDVRTAYLKVDRTALRMVRRTLARIGRGDVSGTSQRGKKSSRYYKRRPQDGRMQFDWPAEQILNYIRALTHPYPGAFFTLSSGNLLVWRASLGPAGSDALPGTILEVKQGQGVLVQVGESRSVLLTEVTGPEDVECWCDVWAAEQGMQAGDRLGDS